MNVPMKWLADFITTDLSPGELADKLTMAGLEAEKITRVGEMWADKVFVGHVETVERHPDADRLVLATVDAGEHRLTVVTGAPNIAQGQRVALAIAGARLYDGHSEELVVKTLKPGSIRGIKSEGMVCSEKELGLSGEHEGILVLPDDAPTGQPLIDYLGDTVIEFEITPNLSHAFSIHGIAREVHALTGTPVSQPPSMDLSTFPVVTEPLVDNTVPDRGPRFVAVAFTGVVVGPSPTWMVRRLEAAGLRAINNVVDVTNYVMHELGQPMHAYDRDRLAEGRLVVRTAIAGEQLLTLDHVQRTLDASMTVIADPERAVGLAGVIGGLDAEVSDVTSNILLECASFDMFATRRTARALRVRTDAAARYERGLDTALPASAVARATHLLLEVCPGARVVAVQDDYPTPSSPSRSPSPSTASHRWSVSSTTITRSRRYCRGWSSRQSSPTTC
jgi:phenylalanyl-tRNA synthetase beta chain